MPRCCGEYIGAAAGMAEGPAQTPCDVMRDGDAEAQGRQSSREAARRLPGRGATRTGRSSAPSSCVPRGSHEGWPWEAGGGSLARAGGALSACAKNTGCESNRCCPGAPCHRRACPGDPTLLLTVGPSLARPGPGPDFPQSLSGTPCSLPIPPRAGPGMSQLCPQSYWRWSCSVWSGALRPAGGQVWRLARQAETLVPGHAAHL